MLGGGSVNTQVMLNGHTICSNCLLNPYGF